MSFHRRDPATPPELQQVAERLRADRPQPTEQELDRAKLRAMTQAKSTGTPARQRRNGAVIRSRRLVSVAIAFALLGGGSAVIAKSGGPSKAASQSSSASTQYCPPSSPGGGKPKKPGPSKCGKP